jgi:anaerobic ribonucleoside-triphosphate reductase
LDCSEWLEELRRSRKQGVQKMSEKELSQYGEGVGFERIRRITGYLVGTVDRFNNAKRAEVNDRVKHGV